MEDHMMEKYAIIQMYKPPSLTEAEITIINDVEYAAAKDAHEQEECNYMFGFNRIYTDNLDAFDHIDWNICLASGDIDVVNYAISKGASNWLNCLLSPNQTVLKLGLKNLQERI